MYYSSIGLSGFQKVTSQSLLLVIMNFSAAVGSPLSGWLYDRIGKHLFLVGGGCALAAWLVFLVGQVVARKKNQVKESLFQM